jgi:hypothetical protein
MLNRYNHATIRSFSYTVKLLTNEELENKVNNSYYQQLENMREIQESNMQIDRIHNSLLHNLNEYLQVEVTKAFDFRNDRIIKYKDIMTNLNDTNVIEKVNIERKIVNVYTGFSDFVRSTLQISKIPIPNEERALYLSSYSTRIGSMERDKTLVDTFVENVKEYENKKEGNNSGSLLDDYADTSTVQPSYMDPED